MNRVRGINEATGEVIGVDLPAQRGRRRKGKRRVFALTDVESMARLELSSLEWSVLNQLIRAASQETHESRITVAEVAENLGKLQPSISRTFAALRERQIIFTLRDGVHRVNSHIMFRGEINDWVIATDTEIEPVWSR